MGNPHIILIHSEACGAAFLTSKAQFFTMKSMKDMKKNLKFFMVIYL